MSDLPKRILFVSPFFHPELISTGRANKYLAEALAADGHRVTVVCSHPLYPAWLPVRSDAELPGIKTLRGGAWLRYPKAMPLRRLMLETWFALYASFRVWRLRKHIDVAVTVLPPSLFALCMHFILPRNVRRVAVIHDLQGVLAAQQESLPRRAIIRLIHEVESRAFRAQNLCVFFSADMAQAARRSYQLNPSRIEVQYPFVTLPPIEESRREFASRRLVQSFSPDKLHVVYSGALGYKQNSHRLVEFMQAAARRHPEVKFHILSGGPFFQELRARYEGQEAPRVLFHPLVAEGDLEELYARSAIQIIPQAEGTESAALPSKLPNLLSAGVFLLAICGRNSEVGRLIRKTGTGKIVESWDETLFLRRLDDALLAVQKEPAYLRRARIEPLLGDFSVANLVRLAVGYAPERENVPASQREEEPVAAEAQREVHR